MVKRYLMSDVRQTERCGDRDAGSDHDAPGGTVHAARDNRHPSTRRAIRQEQRQAER
jgi:hypothetical protein